MGIGTKFGAMAATPWANNTIRNDIFTNLFSLMMFLDHENMGIDTNFITKGTWRTKIG